MKTKKYDWLWVILLLIATIAVDQLSKQLALAIRNSHSLGIFHFTILYNRGTFMGLFSDIPPILRIVSLSTGGAFLVFIFFILQYMLPTRSLMLRFGLSILLGGILGNVIDRIAYGHVIDFLMIGPIFGYKTGVFNIADAVQWVGYGLIAFGLYKERDIFWPSSESRTGSWVNFNYQLRYSMIIVASGLGFALIAGVFSYTFLRYVIIDMSRSTAPSTPESILWSWLLIYIVVTIAFATFLFMIGKHLSHRTAGPIYAFERFIKQLLSGETKELKLRSSDEFKSLENLASLITQELISQGHKDVAPLLPEGYREKLQQQSNEE